MCNIAVAPSRERGLKYKMFGTAEIESRRSFTGAWIEMQESSKSISVRKCRSFTGAWIEIKGMRYISRERHCRSFTGAWIEILQSTPPLIPGTRRSFTGAWIEIFTTPRNPPESNVAPSRERGLKYTPKEEEKDWKQSLLHGSVD